MIQRIQLLCRCGVHEIWNMCGNLKQPSFYNLFWHGKVGHGSMKRIWCELTFKLILFRRNRTRNWLFFVCSIRPLLFNVPVIWWFTLSSRILDARPQSNFVFFMQFSANFGQIIGWRPFSGKSWIRRWILLKKLFCALGFALIFAVWMNP